MAFPTTVPGNGTYHTEDGVHYVVRNSRWEKLRMPVINSAGAPEDKYLDTSSDTQADGSGDYLVCRFNVTQHMPTERVRIQGAFQADTAGNIELGLWSVSEGKWLPKAHYQEHDGLVRWAGSGNGQGLHSWDDGVTWSADAIAIAHIDDTRKCKAGRAQFADISLIATDAQHCLLSIRCLQTVVTDNVVVWNTARSVIDKPITDLSAAFFRTTAGHFTHARFDCEVF